MGLYKTKNVRPRHGVPPMACRFRARKPVGCQRNCVRSGVQKNGVRSIVEGLLFNQDPRGGGSVAGQKRDLVWGQSNSVRCTDF